MVIIGKQAPKAAILNEVYQRTPLGDSFFIPDPDGLILIGSIQTIHQTRKMNLYSIIELTLGRFQVIKGVVNVFSRVFRKFSRIYNDVFFGSVFSFTFTLNERNSRKNN
jgi:hypothetical protein